MTLVAGMLVDRVALWLADHPGSTSHEVAAGVAARASTVAAILQGPLFRKTVVGKRVVYRLGAEGREQTGTSPSGAPETDCDFLARVLADGEPHNLNEILRRSFAERGCGLTVHSRASDLRCRGYRIDHWRDGSRGAGSWYRMAGSVETPAKVSSPRLSGGVSTEPVPADTDGQLVLTGAAFRKEHAA